MELNQISKESEDLYRVYMDNVLDIMIKCDLNANFLHVSPQSFDILGYTPEELIGKNSLDHVHVDDRKKLLDVMSSFTNPGDKVIIELRYIHKDGQHVPVLVKGQLIEINNNIRFIGIINDISERKKSEKIIESEVKFAKAFHLSPHILAITRMEDSRIIDVNDKFIQVLGYNREEIIGKSATELNIWVNLEDRNKFITALKAIENILDFEVQVKTKSGNIRHMLISGAKISLNNEPHLVTMAIDVTDLKITQQKLRDSEEKYRYLFENMNAGFAYHEVITDDNDKPIDYKFLEVNPMYEALTGLKAKDMIGKSVTEVLPGIENDPADWISKFGNVGLTGIPLTVEGYSEPNDRWYKVSGYAPKRGYFAVTFNDITDRKKAEAEIELGKKKLELYIDSMMDGFCINDPIGNIVQINESFVKMFDYEFPEEIIGKKIFEMVSKKEIPIMMNRFMDTVKNKESGIKNFEVVCIRKDGSEFSGSFNIRNLWEEGKYVGSISISRDITERKNAEENLILSKQKYHEAYIQANFFKDIISHDINNLLQNIKASLELYKIFQDDPTNVETQEEVLEIIDNAVSRGERLIYNVRKLSKLEDTEILIENTEICKLLDDSIDFLTKCFQDKKINVKVDAPSKKVYVKANALLLDVFENILNNSVKYNDNHEVELFVKILEGNELDKKKYVKMEFMDNGIGIPDARKAVIFQKGFKESSSMTGLGIGLSLVKKVIESYDGKIWVEDKVKGDFSKGANLVLLIPEAEVLEINIK